MDRRNVGNADDLGGMLGGVVAERDRAHLTIPFLRRCFQANSGVLLQYWSPFSPRTAALYGLAGLPTSRNGAV